MLQNTSNLSPIETNRFFWPNEVAVVRPYQTLLRKQKNHDVSKYSKNQSSQKTYTNGNVRLSHLLCEYTPTILKRKKLETFLNANTLSIGIQITL